MEAPKIKGYIQFGQRKCAE